MLAGFPGGYGDARFYAGCVWLYSKYLKQNLKTEDEKARKKYHVYRPVALIPIKVEEKNVEHELEKVEKEAVFALKSNGFAA